VSGGEDDKQASLHITSEVEGKKILRVILCEGDQDHEPHIQIECSDGATIHIICEGGELVVGVAHSMQAAGHARADLHSIAEGVQ
jgi:hypothetical protein